MRHPSEEPAKWRSEALSIELWGGAIFTVSIPGEPSGLVQASRLNAAETVGMERSPDVIEADARNSRLADPSRWRSSGHDLYLCR